MSAEIIETPNVTPQAEADPQTQIMQFVERFGIDKLGPEQRLDAIRHATPEAFVFGLSAVHQVVAPDTDPSPTDFTMKLYGKDKQTPTHVLAQPEERMTIFDTAYSLAHQVIEKYDQQGGDINNVLERVANLAAFSIVLAHPFENGNGRTARTVGQLIRFGADMNDPDNTADLLACATERPTTGFRINSYVPNGSSEPIAFLNEIAAVDVPFEATEYRQAAQYTTPYELTSSYIS